MKLDDVGCTFKHEFGGKAFYCHFLILAPKINQEFLVGGNSRQRGAKNRGQTSAKFQI